MSHFGVLLLSARFKYPIEHVDRDQIVALNNCTKKWARRLSWTAHSVNFLVVTDESPKELMHRIGPALEAITALDDCTCIQAGFEAAGLLGGVHPLAAFLDMAWAEAKTKNIRFSVPKRSKPQHFHQPRPADPPVENRVENFPDSTFPKMQARAQWERKKQSRSDHD